MVQESRQLYMSQVAAEYEVRICIALGTLIHHVCMTFRRRIGRKRIAGPERGVAAVKVWLSKLSSILAFQRPDTQQIWALAKMRRSSVKAIGKEFAFAYDSLPVVLESNTQTRCCKGRIRCRDIFLSFEAKLTISSMITDKA